MSNNKNKKGLRKRSPLREIESPQQKSVSALRKSVYYTYILKCDNCILYTGIATDYERRFGEHAKLNGSKKGAKFTKSHKPEKIVAVWKAKTRSDASKLEARIKQLEKIDKLLLIYDNKHFKAFFTSLIDCRKFRRVV